MFPVRRIVIGRGVDGVEKGKPIQGSKGYVSGLGCLTLRLLSQLLFAKVKLKFTLTRDVNCPQLFAHNNTRPVMDPLQIFSSLLTRFGPHITIR
jgi:hypothetical protein